MFELRINHRRLGVAAITTGDECLDCGEGDSVRPMPLDAEESAESAHWRRQSHVKVEECERFDTTEDRSVSEG